MSNNDIVRQIEAWDAVNPDLWDIGRGMFVNNWFSTFFEGDIHHYFPGRTNIPPWRRARIIRRVGYSLQMADTFGWCEELRNVIQAEFNRLVEQHTQDGLGMPTIPPPRPTAIVYQPPPIPAPPPPPPPAQDPWEEAWGPTEEAANNDQQNSNQQNNNSETDTDNDTGLDFDEISTDDPDEIPNVSNDANSNDELLDAIGVVQEDELPNYADDDVCNICYEEENFFKAGCGHWMGGNCFVQWMKESHTCPTCRAEILQISIREVK